MEDITESLVARRPRRSTAGNRMQAVLADFALQGPDPDDNGDEDIDFVTQDEDDLFGSDFASTDDESTAEEGSEANTYMSKDEVRRTRKRALSQVERSIKRASEQQQNMFTSTVSLTRSSLVDRPKRHSYRVDLSRPSNGSGADHITKLSVLRSGTRQSRRQSTIVNTSETDARVRQKGLRQGGVMKKIQSDSQELTQDELIRRALDMEEGNTTEHHNYLSIEEEKRQRARVLRPTIHGPLLRWISKTDVCDGPVDGPCSIKSLVHTTDRQSRSLDRSYLSAGLTAQKLDMASSWSVSPLAVGSTVQTAKTFIIYEKMQDIEAPEPQWKETMCALFGSHVKWDQLKVYSNKNHPMGTPMLMCPVSGLPAKYKHPTLGVPFASVGVYKILESFEDGGGIWNQALGCYLYPE